MILEGSVTRKAPPDDASQIPPVKVPPEKFVGVGTIDSVPPLEAVTVPLLVTLEPVTRRI